MSFKSAIEKVKQMFTNNVDEQMQKYETELHKSTNDVVEMRISVNGKVISALCVSITPGSDIDRVQELYGNIGIKLKKHILKRGNRNQNVLYITASDYGKLDVKRQKYFKRTVFNHKLYKQNLTYSIDSEKLK